jgi:hypothetical protein
MARPHWGLSLRFAPAATRAHLGGPGVSKDSPECVKRNLVKQTRTLYSADGHSSIAPVIADGPPFKEIIALLAEILVLDYQEHKQITVGSPPRNNRNVKLNSLRLVQDEE